MAVLFAMFGVVAVAKATRDKVEGVPVSAAFTGLSYAAVIIPSVGLAVALWMSSEPATARWALFIAAVLLVYASATVQKNVRDLAVFTKLALIAPPDRRG